VTANAAIVIASGSVRRASLTSAEAYVECCQPPYDHSTPTMAVARAAPMPPGTDAIAGEKSVVWLEPRNRPTATRPAIPASFSTVKMSEKIAPAFTPTTFTIVSASRPPTATALVAPGPSGTK
jgi:hypothetical protein